MGDVAAEVLKHLRKPHHKAATGVYEAYHVTTFEVVRSAPDNSMQVVRLEVCEAGPESEWPPGRFRVVATSEDGHRVISGRAESVAIVLDILRWQELDLPPKDVLLKRYRRKKT